MTTEEGNKIATEECWFYGLEKINKTVNLPADKSARIKAGMFGLILEKILEAKREIAKLEAAVQRMESAARAGTIVKPAEGKNFTSADIQRIRSEMKALHGWTISLLESDISILAAVESPRVAGQSVTGLQKSFAELWALRVQAGFKMMGRMPGVFDRVISY
ncbi:MAG: hypothetical protein HY820_06720 [Acidobacteria bacterium]|nr:hypothetical protein [Acidobacteriota bacterium]